MRTCTALNLCLFLCFLSACTIDETVNERPNILLIIADDLGKEALSSYNPDAQPTPNLDQWANEGWQFNNFYVTSPVCSPSRASMLTGYPMNVNGVDRVLNPNRPGAELADSLNTIADHLRATGYQTNLVGKWHLGYASENHPLERGFDHFSGFLTGHIDYLSHVDSGGEFGLMKGHEQWLPEDSTHLTELLTDEALAIMTDSLREQPYCLVLSYATPHRPFLLPGEDPIFPGRADRTKDTPERYQAMVALLDQQIGRIQQMIAQRNDNTLVIFLSDNGEWVNMNAGKSNTGKGTLFEGGVNIPAVIYWPGQLSPQQIDGLYTSLDLLPTVLQAVMAKNPLITSPHGKSILSHQENNGHQTVSLNHRDVKMLRTGALKALFIPNNNSRVSQRHLAKHNLQASDMGNQLIDGHIPLLYRLDEDPHEMRNLASSEPALVDSLWQLYQNSK